MASLFHTSWCHSLLRHRWWLHLVEGTTKNIYSTCVLPVLLGVLSSGPGFSMKGRSWNCSSTFSMLCHPCKVKEGQWECSAILRQLHSISQLRSVTCHWDDSVTCHLTQVNTLHLNTSQTGRYSIYLPQRDARPSLPRWLAIYRYGLPALRWSPPPTDGPSTNRQRIAGNQTQQRDTLTTTLLSHQLPGPFTFTFLPLMCFRFVVIVFAVREVSSKRIWHFRRTILWSLQKWNLLLKYGILIVSELVEFV